MTHQLNLKVYIAGPMTGLPLNNYPAFDKADEDLRNQGLCPLNPARNKASNWQGFMRCSLRQIAEANVMYMLKGWDESKGAKIEHKLAQDLGMPIFYEEGARPGWATGAGHSNSDPIKSCTKQVAPGVKEGWTIGVDMGREAKLAEQVVKAAYTSDPNPFHSLPLGTSPDNPSTGKDIPKAKEQFVVLALDVFDKWAPMKYFDDYAKAEAFRDRLRMLVPGLPVDLQPVKNPV